MIGEIIYPKNLKQAIKPTVGNYYYHHGIDPLKCLGQDRDGKFYFQFLDNSDYDMFGTDDLSQIYEVA